MNDLAMTYLIAETLNALALRNPGLIEDISTRLNSYDWKVIPDGHVGAIHEAQSWLWRNFTAHSSPPTFPKEG